MNKPTIEESEAQVKQLAMQLELSVAAERAWETTMMRVCGEDGPLSVAVKLNQLAAENAALNTAAKKVIKMNRQHAKEKHGDPNIAEAWESVKTLRKARATPATDTILASLRAEGVEMLAKQCATNHVYSFTQRHALEFAAQLRNGSEK